MAERLIDIREVLDRTGYGRTSLYRAIKDSGFPQGRQVSPQRVRWVESEIDAWMLDQAPKADIPEGALT